MAPAATHRKADAWRALLAAYARVHGHVAEELESKMGLPVNFFEVLAALSQAPDGRLPMRELADSVLLSKSGLTRVVDRMVVDGLVGRTPSASDRRVVYACLTDQGRARFEGAAPIHHLAIEQYFGRHLDDAEADMLSSLLSRISLANGTP